MAYAPESETLEICRDLIRLDTTNYGDDSGPGERKAAEYVAAALAEVGIESEMVESEPGRTSLVARWGNQDSPKPGLLVHGHLDVVPARASDWQVDPFAAEIVDGYLFGRGAVDMKDFDAMLLSMVRARQRAGVIPDRPDHPGVHRRRGGRWAQGRALDRRAPTRPAGGLHRGHRRGRRLLHRDRRAASVPDRVRREGHRVDAAAGPRHRRSRLDGQPRQRHHPPGARAPHLG